jgi:hypothetical protein
MKNIKSIKKLMYIVISTILCIVFFTVPTFASETTPPDGTVTPNGIYGIVHDIGVSPDISPRYALFASEISLDSGRSFTSYQYEVPASNSYIGISIAGTNAKYKVSLYGSNTIGGARTFVGSATSRSTAVANEFSHKYKYYNIVVTNTGNTSGVAYVSLYSD